MSLRSLPIPLACCAALVLGCKAPVSPPSTGAAVGEPPARSALRVPSRLEERPDRPERGERNDRAGTADHPDPVTPRPFQRCFAEDTAASQQRPLGALLDRAADLYDQASQRTGQKRGAALPPEVLAQYERSLACAEEAARVEPRSVEAHHGRALALQELGRLEAARDAITRALALDPDDPETLASAADLYINRLPPGLDHTETGLEHARRGSRRARRTRDKALIARLALLEGQALNDLGHAREALARLDASLAAEDDVRVRYERAVALFDLCRFEDARRGFDEVVAKVPDDAWGHHHLGLVLEVLGKTEDAERAFARARELAPRDFPAPLQIGHEEFRQIVAREVQGLTPALQKDLTRATLETADLPDVADLTAEEPPLSPTILGLFRGAPLPPLPGEGPPASGVRSELGLSREGRRDPVSDREARSAAVMDREARSAAVIDRDGRGAAMTDRDGRGAAALEPRTIVLYRKNLLRAVTTRDELVTQVRTTLLHELGHLRGEDDEVLRARGLE